MFESVWDAGLGNRKAFPDLDGRTLMVHSDELKSHDTNL